MSGPRSGAISNSSCCPLGVCHCHILLLLLHLTWWLHLLFSQAPTSRGGVGGIVNSVHCNNLCSTLRFGKCTVYSMSLHRGVRSRPIHQIAPSPFIPIVSALSRGARLAVPRTRHPVRCHFCVCALSLALAHLPMLTDDLHCSHHGQTRSIVLGGAMMISGTGTHSRQLAVDGARVHSCFETIASHHHHFSV